MELSVNKTSIYYKRISCLSLKGNDGIDFINRISTNDFSYFTENSFKWTFFTSEKGKIIDLVLVLFFEKELILIGSFENRNVLKNHLDKYLFTEDVLISECNNFRYYGILFGDINSEILIEKYDFANNLFLYKNICLFKNDFDDNSKIILFNDSSALKSVATELDIYDEMSYDMYRINKFIPEQGKEITNKVNPLECNLEKYVSFNKGCYIGQEVIARLESQNKKTFTLIRFKFETNYDIDNFLFIDKNTTDEECCIITTKVKKNEVHYCLGFIRSKYLENTGKHFTKDINNNQIFINLF